MPTRSASFSFARVKLICCCMAAPCAMAMPPRAASLEPVAAPTRMAARMDATVAMLCAALGSDAPRDVTLRDVRDFVREHAGKLGFVARREDETEVDADESARQCEGIDGVVAHEEEREALRRIPGGLRDDARAEALDVFGRLGVLDDLAFVAELAHDLQADVVLIVDRERGGGGAADVGQIVAGRLRQRL